MAGGACLATLGGGDDGRDDVAALGRGERGAVGGLGESEEARL